MSDENQNAAEIRLLKQQQARMIHAMRLCLLLMLLAVGFTCIRSAMRIPTMQRIYQDLMPGTALPFTSQLLFEHPKAWMAGDVLLSVLGLIFVAGSRGLSSRIIGTAVVIAVLFVQWQVMDSAMQLPMIRLLEGVGEPGK